MSGLASWATAPRSPIYSKVYADDDTELSSAPGFRTRKASKWSQRPSPKLLAVLVAPILIVVCFIFTVVSYPVCVLLCWYPSNSAVGS